MSTSVVEPFRKLAENSFETGWGARTPVRWPNVAFSMPRNAAWVAFNVVDGDSAQVSIGPTGYRMQRSAPTVIVQVFVPKHSGIKALNEHCDAAAAIFRMKTLVDSVAGIEAIFRTPSFSSAVEELELIRKNVSVDAQVDSLW